MRLPITIAILLCASAGFAADPLQAVFQRMDQASAVFKGFTADLERLDHHDFVGENDQGSGTIAVRKSGPRNILVLENIQTQNGKPEVETIEFNGTHVTVYHPKDNKATEYDVSKKYRGVEGAAVAILGGSSKELQQDYKVAYGSPETVNGQPATRLRLTPNEQQLAQMFPKIEVWISDAGIAVQQKFYEPGEKDFHVFTYSKMKLGPVSDSQVKLILPKGVVRERPH
jgi:outer membrane lipoprotein-sorting protein